MFTVSKKQTLAFLLTCALVALLSLLIGVIALGLCLVTFLSDSFHGTWLALTLGTTFLVLALFFMLTLGVYRKNHFALIAAPLVFLAMIDYLILVFDNFHPRYVGLDMAFLARIALALIVTLLIGGVYVRELRRNWR